MNVNYKQYNISVMLDWTTKKNYYLVCGERFETLTDAMNDVDYILERVGVSS